VSGGHCLKNERPGETLQGSDLGHEAYLHLADVPRLDWRHRNHFFAMSATLMRRILVDRVRRRAATKRGRAEGIDVQQALNLASNRPAEIVELRFFAGLGVKETAGGRRFFRHGHARLETGEGVAIERIDHRVAAGNTAV
jgi:RNA polymerase sigma-70 factor, ECF subfamily